MRTIPLHALSMRCNATRKTKLAEPVTVREDRMDE